MQLFLRRGPYGEDLGSNYGGNDGNDEEDENDDDGNFNKNDADDDDGNFNKNDVDDDKEAFPSSSASSFTAYSTQTSKSVILLIVPKTYSRTSRR